MRSEFVTTVRTGNRIWNAMQSCTNDFPDVWQSTLRIADREGVEDVVLVERIIDETTRDVKSVIVYAIKGTVNALRDNLDHLYPGWHLARHIPEKT
ncbi:hypothetical protein A3C37_02715 [Candidatus Peribacteria bacterium RIFCSPHIGHO2_02_FULL_53_20]|nr:MAG: hypothetical protein A3C37_02715 [Candidatus Peribacteria bacterium RIFCSPHIGHO2_02_FULL_53_20]OGJ68111.1 MAG: hypothetical protein A3B61_02405 [Candidatus Peribacteria bacterium RIFCSPLOWO2_01_FULL_53_10]OGJ70050.1 MAG: hypothetical protein A3G69_02805 [Candidatus Peribacteria bacterium RIFCSPLOWO2_12_FULL_53_10]HLC66455.1 hypothetical protein [Candidatus Nanoarchaeia archaeon]